MWDDFSSAFLDLFIPQELRKVKTENFVYLKQGIMMVKEYALKFHQLPRYALELLSCISSRMRKFASVLSRDFILESNTILLNKDMDISRLVVDM